MGGKFGGEINLADWRICERTTKLNSANYFSMISFGGWSLEASVRVQVALYKYFTREHLTYPTEVPSLLDKQVEKTTTACASFLLPLSRLHENSSPTFGVHVRL